MEKQTPNQIKDRILTENTAQAVLKHLRANQSNRLRMLARWIWELLQNARDTAAATTERISASIEYEHGDLVFQHNGPAFSMAEVAHLIFHGSTKIEDADTIGQYGSGFLTTHLISPEIEVSGQLDNGQKFQFHIERKDSSVQDLTDSMNQAWDDFNISLSETVSTGDFTTRFRYPVADDSSDAVMDGIAQLKQCAPFVIAFNPEFSKIEIKSQGEYVRFEEAKREPSEDDFPSIVAVRKNDNGTETCIEYLVNECVGTSVVIPLQRMSSGYECIPAIGIPKLFLGFPLVGTEDFSFPAVINSFEFTPTEDRDGVFLGRRTNGANINNQKIIQNACALMIGLLQFAASHRWRNICVLADVPDICITDWMDPDWLRETLKEQFIQKVRETPAVLVRNGEILSPSESRLPVSDASESVDALWHLLDNWNKIRNVLPIKEEVVGWSCTIKSWGKFYDSGNDASVSVLSEIIDGTTLAAEVDNETRADADGCAKLEDLQELLYKDIAARDWLDELHQFFNSNNLRESVSEFHLVLDQNDFLDKLSALHRDCEVAGDLKDIAELLEWELRDELRDVGLSSLADESGSGDLQNDDVVRDLLDKLNKRATEKTDQGFAQASSRLFSWLAGQGYWDQMRNFPAFSRETGQDKLTIVYTPRTPQDEDMPLAPVPVWQEDIKPFADIFPLPQVLANDFFDELEDSTIWQTLDEQEKIVRTNLIITKREIIRTFSPNESLADGDHSSSKAVEVTDLVSRSTIMARVRDSRHRALLFWRFVVEWLIEHDSRGLEIHKTPCECGVTHRYHRAAWLEPLRRDSESWIRLEDGKRYPVNATSLAKLLRSSETDVQTHSNNPAVQKLLDAIGVSRFELMQELFANNEESRENLERAFVDILATTEGDIERLNQAREYIEDLKNDQDLPTLLEERRERRRIVHANQSLGQQVEHLVKESLESEGFVVRRTGVGSDFEIQPETDEVVNLELARDGKTWLVEVKATRNRQDVRMTATQGRTAVKEGTRFLLCVVNVEENDPEMRTVRDGMRFVENIGDTVAPLCRRLDKFEGLKDEITASNMEGVQLEVISGAARFRIASSVWEKNGLALQELADKLTET